MKYVRRYAWCAAMGIMLASLGYGVLTWQFYVCFVVMSLLVGWSRHGAVEEYILNLYSLGDKWDKADRGRDAQ